MLKIGSLSSANLSTKLRIISERNTMKMIIIDYFV
jgi:hypothetical protein